MTIEALMDAGELFVSGLRLGLPSPERGIVALLADQGILEASEANLLRRMHGFRNVLVHRYGSLDDHRVYDNLRRAPNEIPRIIHALREALDQRAPPST